MESHQSDHHCLDIFNYHPVRPRPQLLHALTIPRVIRERGPRALEAPDVEH